MLKRFEKARAGELPKGPRQAPSKMPQGGALPNPLWLETYKIKDPKLLPKNQMLMRLSRTAQQSTMLVPYREALPRSPTAKLSKTSRVAQLQKTNKS